MDNNAGAAAAQTLAAITTTAQLSAAFPALCSELAIAAATAERGRILGIAALADASNGALIAELQGDGKTSPAEAALRILNAQKEARGQRMQAIADVEQTTSAVRPSTSSSAAPQGDNKPKASTPEGWKAEYEASADLQAEFGSAGAYVAYKTGEASGRIKRLERKSA